MDTCELFITLLLSPLLSPIATVAVLSIGISLFPSPTAITWSSCASKTFVIYCLSLGMSEKDTKLCELIINVLNLIIQKK